MYLLELCRVGLVSNELAQFLGSLLEACSTRVSAVRPSGRSHRAWLGTAGAWLQWWPGRCCWTDRGSALCRVALAASRWPALLVGPARVAPQPPLVASRARRATLWSALAARLPHRLARCSVALRGCVPTLVDAVAIAAGSTRRRPAIRLLVPTGCRACVAVAVVWLSGPVRCGEAMRLCLGYPR
jgi:hypothetical protein